MRSAASAPSKLAEQFTGTLKITFLDSVASDRLEKKTEDPRFMRRKNMSKVCIRSRIAFLVVLIWPAAALAQQDSMKACNLLSPAELGAAIGGSVGHPMGIFTPKNPKQGRNGDFWSCEQTVGTRKVWIFYNTLQVTEEGKKQQQELTERLRKQGYQIQEKELNGSRCATRVPPGSVKGSGLALETSCGREKGPYQVIVAVDVTGANDLVSLEKVASLTEKAASRAPAH
jgi:hypothetical protein